MDLLRFQRPSRYIDGEINALRKDAPLRMALAFPDIYDVGMSHLGMRILYDIVNGLPYSSAERVFHPWLDMADFLKGAKAPLSSLETKRPLVAFDVVGFSLQYELSYTSVLNMLSLGGIPVRSSERSDAHPIVIAGGPCAVNPMPMAPFVDAFLVGDGEKAIVEIMDTIFRCKTEGDGKRESAIRALSEIEGVYAPDVHMGNAENIRIKRRFISSLDEAPYPCAPVVPFTQIVHDRVNIEVSRGCTMGCRFCQAGMIYRPLRERRPEKVLALAGEALKNTGYEEVAFTSLSAGDYPALLPLLRAFKKRHGMVSVSLPSLRVKAVDRDILREIKSVRKTGFTIAPEAASERLRCVINKDFGEEDFERALDALFSEGWQNLKLYFMVGLPTETDEDVEAIPKMAMKALRAAKKYTSRFVNLSVSVSPFVPKPHTPFQWHGQAPLDEIRRKKEYLRGALRKVNLKGHDEEMSLLEAAFSRGDGKLSSLLEAAWREGARLDGWTESFDYSLWLRAMEKTGVDASEYAGRAIGRDEPLPWEMIDTGIKKEFLLGEFDHAVSAEITEGCTARCTACGLECSGGKSPFLTGNDRLLGRKGPSSPSPLRKPIRVRAVFSKDGTMRYLSHRELMTHMTRAMRRAGVRFEYSQGFHPAPRISFGPPLGVGVSGLREYFDMVIVPGAPLNSMRDAINAGLAGGIRVHSLSPVGFDEPSLQDFISRYEYEILITGSHETSPIKRGIASFLGKEEALVEREDKKVNIRPMVEEADFLDGSRVRLTVRDLADKKVRLDEVVSALFGISCEGLEITRLSMQGKRKGQWETPTAAQEALEAERWPAAS